MGRLTRLAVLAIVLLLSACNPMDPGHEPGPEPIVRLTGSGAVPVQLNSTGGVCGGLPGSFYFDLELDVGLGLGFSAREDSPGSFTLTLTTAAETLNPSGGLEPDATFASSGVTAGVSEDYPTITFDTDLVGETGTEHIKGSITCPGPGPTSPPPA
jgi:hypothetical protein